GSGSHVAEDVFMAGSAIELLHTESVIHDDIIDEERLRRGKPSFHVKYGYNSSVLTADFVLGIILNIGSKMNNSRVMSELSSAATKMSEGEMMEIRFAKHNDITEDEYIKVIEHKTASLFEASTKIGAILGDGQEDQIHALGNYGNLLGIAYQLHDDLLDWDNEDRLFNLLVKHNIRSVEFISKMNKLYRSYSSKALNELRNVSESMYKRHLELLTDLSSIQF
ncbi:MAG: polyprenyl synthetase family protein, partial [Thermoproteota archaeon]|nr:polyprenyl synthetase family protein [Thermoproteota archaeon]